MEKISAVLCAPRRERTPGGMTQYSFRVPNEMGVRFDELSKQTGMTPSALLNLIFEEAFDRIRVVERKVKVVTFDWGTECEDRPLAAPVPVGARSARAYRKGGRTMKKPLYVTQDREVRAIVNACASRAGITDMRNLSPILHVAPSTVYAKLKRPETFTLGELRRLVAYFHVKPEEISRIF